MNRSDPILSVRRRVLVYILLLISFGCNLSIFFVPFMDLRMGFISNPYDLFSSIHMLWDAKLYVLVILVVGFSVMFPFIKLATLATICSAPGGVLTPRRQRWLVGVEHLGKWSMLDVFMVCLILSLTSDQLFVGARPLIGIPLFVFAIVLSMTCGEILCATLPAKKVNSNGAKTSWRIGFWLVLTGLALGATLFAPFLQISDWYLSDNSYSIVSIIPLLWQDNSPVAAVIIGLFLIVFPVIGWLVSVCFWLRLKMGKSIGMLHRWLHFFRRWSMQDVFGLALCIFLLEGSYLMNTEIRIGAIYLLASLLFRQLFQIALERSVPDENTP